MNESPRRTTLTPIKTIFLIARREFVTRVRTRVYIIGTVIVLVALVGFVFLQVRVLNKRSTTPTYTVAFLGEAQALANPLLASSSPLGFKVDRKSVSDQTQAEGEIQKGTLDVLVSGSATSPQVIVLGQLNGTLQAALQGIVRQLALDSALTAAGINPASIGAQVAQSGIHVQSLKATSGERIQLVVAGFVVALFLYVALVTYGTFIAQGVVEEKANRIVEILLSTVRPEQLLIGKVVGVGLVGLLQFAVIGAAAFILTTRTGLFTVPAAAGGVILVGLLWFILGFFLYAILFAAAASLVSRQEEVQSAVLPITMPAVISWLLAIGVLVPMFGGLPMSTVGILLSLIPFFAPVLMPAGIGTGDIAAWQALLAVALTLATSAVATWVAARIYSNSVLRIGARVKLSEALAVARPAPR